MTTNTATSLKLVAAGLAALALVACSKPEDATVGQQVDSAIAKVEQGAEKTADSIKAGAADASARTEAAAERVGEKIGNVTTEVASKVEDAAITASVNAELAQDPKLSAIKINVDTVNGRVALKGTAPDVESRERAAKLAAAVRGVVSVDNRLVVVAS